MTAPVASFELKDGTQLTLYPNRVVHEGGGNLEIVPLAHLAAVRVAFERDARKLNWVIALLIAALTLAAAAGPLLGWSSSAAAKIAEHARKESLDAVLLAVFSAIVGFARMLPTIATALGAIAAALALVFVLGRTTLTLSFAAVERAYAVRGRNRPLIEFAEVLGEQLAARGK